MQFSKTLLLALAAVVAAQESSAPAQPVRLPHPRLLWCITTNRRKRTTHAKLLLQENPATAYLAQTNADGAVTGQPAAATSQEAAASVAAGGTTALGATQTGEATATGDATGTATGTQADATQTGDSTQTSSGKKTESTSDSTKTSSSSSSSSTSSPSSGAGAINEASQAGLTLGLAGFALAAFL